MGQKYLVAGKHVSMRLWVLEPGSELKAATRRVYETVGYVISGSARLDLEGQKASSVEEPKPVSSERKQVGHASWYSLPSKTANGEQMNEDKLTAAHPTLPFGTKVEVENLENGRKTTVRVNDRGPFVAGRIIDVSKAAARTLDMIADGIATVRIRPKTGSTE
jgi:rare lipoprotein A